MSLYGKWRPSVGFLINAFIATVLFTALFVFTIFPVTELAPLSALKLGTLCCFLGFNLTTLFYASFTHTLNSRYDSIWTDDRSLIGAIGTAQGCAIILGLTNHITPSETLVTVSVLQVWNTFHFFKLACNTFHSTPGQLRYAPFVASSFMGLFAIAAFPLRNWFPIPDLIAKSLFWHGLVITCGLIALPIWIIKSNRSTSDHQSLIQQIQIRLSGDLEDISRQAIFLSCLASGFLSMGLCFFAGLSLGQDQKGIPSWVIAGCSTLLIPALLLSWTSLHQQAERYSELVVSSKLAGSSALRLLKRNLRDAQSWAAAIGVRTSIYTVDYDPDGTMARSMPASVLQIRNEEIQRCISDVLGRRILHTNNIGQQVVGAVDPEFTSKPCIDIIKLFACLYLDAGPLVERRINGLSTLLPIINPGLATILKTNVLSDLLKRNQWFFYFDYQWVDQHLINTPQGTRYGVHIDPLSHELRQSMVLHLQRAHGMGSFLWMGKEAHDRLIQEAPMLVSIIEPVSISSNDGSEQLVFTLKFENLIPRLQRYFDLDETRKVLLDYEPSVESSKLINIFKVQGSQATTHEAMINLVESVSSYPWRGFKEKDQALKIVIIAHQFNTKVLTNCVQNNQPIPRMAMKLREAIQVSIERIGYPSQLLHLAQMHKIAQRDVQQLIRSATSIHDSRFEESWTLLGSLDFRRHGIAERILVARLMVDERLLASILDRPDIQPKLIEAFINIVRCEHQIGNSTFPMEQSLSCLVDVLSKKQPSAETLTLLLDGVTFLGQMLGQNYPSLDPLLLPLESQVKRFESAKTAYAAGLWNRWVEIKQRSKILNVA